MRNEDYGRPEPAGGPGPSVANAMMGFIRIVKRGGTYDDVRRYVQEQKTNLGGDLYDEFRTKLSRQMPPVIATQLFY